MNDRQEDIEEKETYEEDNPLRDKSEEVSELELKKENESEVDIVEKNEAHSEQITNNEGIEGSLEEEAVQETQKEEITEDLHNIHKNLIEGAIYAAGRPLDVEEIATKLEISKKNVEDLITELAYEYLDRSSALVIAQVGERYQMQLRPEYTETVSKFTKGGAIAEKYLRTLTIIALKQPILKSTVIKIRGTGAYEHIKYLEDNDLISAEKKGRSHELTTTDKYADMFGLPKNREELKRTMVSQLGLDEIKD